MERQFSNPHRGDFGADRSVACSALSAPYRPQSDKATAILAELRGQTVDAVTYADPLLQRLRDCSDLYLDCFLPEYRKGRYSNCPLDIAIDKVFDALDMQGVGLSI